ncbi:MAG: hypothetical protein LCI02_21420 [Proteobacteria bacterium]|nr:hypothetical protein [Pseudomonadota bacterium]
MADRVIRRLTGFGHLAQVKRVGEVRDTCNERYIHAAARRTDNGHGVLLHDRLVGFAVGLSGQSQRNVKTRQALGFALEAQVQNIE